MQKEYFLQEGQLTKFSPRLKELASKVSGDDAELLQNIFSIVKSTLETKAKHTFSQEEFVERLHKEHQRRTVDEVIESGYNYGCDEFGMFFATIARIKGIPTKYIQCAEVVSYATKTGTNGHVYLECYFPDETYLLDSTRGTIIPIRSEEDKQQLYFVDVPEHKHIMVEAFTGLDPWDAGIKSHQDMVNSLIAADEKYLQNHTV